jgi:hypothetical protein
MPNVFHAGVRHGDGASQPVARWRVLPVYEMRCGMGRAASRHARAAEGSSLVNVHV